ncbi:MAG: hypothetical protein R3D71_07605 [Rickettsiales bacterium]
MPDNIKKHSNKSGFSLIQMSVIVAVAGIIAASVIPAGNLGSDIEKERITKERMEKIEDAMQSFMATNLRRPCPEGNTFGIEATFPGNCIGGADFFSYSAAGQLSKTGNISSTSSTVTGMNNTTGLRIGMRVNASTGITDTSNTFIQSVDSATQITLNKYPTATGSRTLYFYPYVAGTVPVRTLGLPDEYMFDGYGRKIRYIVDTGATEATICRDMQTTKTKGYIQIMDSASATYTTDNVMWALVSYGKNGHGALPIQGSGSLSTRINTGSTSADELVNAAVDSSFNYAFTQKLVRHEPVTTFGATYFDDIIWTREDTKNTCCVGKLCNVGATFTNTTLSNIIINSGDINGDGIKDIIASARNSSKIYIIFGKNIGWTSPNSSMNLDVANSSRFVTITNNSSYSYFTGKSGLYGESIAVGDINGDSYDDIVIGYGDGTSSGITIFYGSASPVDTNTSSLTDIITFPATSESAAPNIKLGHFTGASGKDIIALIKTASGVGNSTAYVIYGAASYGAKTADTTNWLQADTTGFKIDTTTSVLSTFIGLKSMGSLNGDSYDDIILNDNTNKNINVMFGRAKSGVGSWDSVVTTVATGSTPDIINLDTRIAAADPTKEVRFTGLSSNNYTADVAELTGDTYDDIMFNNGNYLYVYFGKAGWASPIDVTATASYNGTNGFRINVASNKPGTVDDLFYGAIIKDINSDGKSDIVMNDWATSGYSYIALQPNDHSFTNGWNKIWSSGEINLFGDLFDDTGTGLPLQNDVNNGFRIKAKSSEGSYVYDLVDINNDGKGDIIISNGSTEIYILFGRNLVSWETENLLDVLN